MKFSVLSILTFSFLTVGCGSEGSSGDSSLAGDAGVGTAHLGLTVIDCQTEATQCVSSAKSRFLQATLGCSGKLTACLADASAQAATQVIESSDEVLGCGTSNVQCVADAQKLTDVLGCERKVASCVVGTVESTTGIVLPAALTAVEEVVESATGVVGEVADSSLGLVDQVVESTGSVTGTVVETAGELVQTSVGVVGEVAATTASSAGEVVQTGVGVVSVVATATVQSASAAVDNTLSCSQTARSCWRSTRRLLGCQADYAACLVK